MNEPIDKQALLQVLKRRENKGKCKELAALVGVKPNMLSMWLHGRSPSSRLDVEIPRALKRLGLKARRAA